MWLNSLLIFLVLTFSNPLFAQDLPAASAVYYKALKLYQREDWNGAMEYFHQYLAEYSDSPLYITSLYYLGHCYEKLHDVKEAVSIYHKVIDEARAEEDLFWAQMSEKRIEELIP